MNAQHWLFVTPFYKPAHVYGGPTYSIPALCEGLARAGARVTVFTTSANGRTRLPVAAGVPQDVDGVEVYYFALDISGTYFYSTQLALACIGRIRPAAFDVVYVASNWGFPFIPASLTSMLAKVPYIVSPRASFKRNTWRGKFLKKLAYHWLIERLLIQKAALIHYTTKLEEHDSAWLGLAPPYVVIPNPVDFDKFVPMPPRGRFRARFNISAARKLVLILGRVDPDKGLDLALTALKSVVQSDSSVTLVIAGPEENGYLRFLRRRAAELDVAAHVVYTGFLDASQRLEALVDADLLFSPSRSENFGMSIVEGMACGLPVLVSDHVGVADLILGERLGLVVPLDPAAMAKALISMLREPQPRALCTGRAAEAVRETFSVQAVANSYLRAFATAAGEH